MRDTESSYIGTKNTPEEKTAEQCVVAPEKKTLKEEESHKQAKDHLSGLTDSLGQNKTKSKEQEEDISKEENLPYVDYIVNKQWRSLR